MHNKRREHGMDTYGTRAVVVDIKHAHVVITGGSDAVPVGGDLNRIDLLRPCKTKHGENKSTNTKHGTRYHINTGHRTDSPCCNVRLQEHESGFQMRMVWSYLFW